MSTSQNNNWKVYSIRKLIEYGTLVVAAWQLGIPAANNWHEDRTKNYMEEHKSSKPFREVLSDEWGVKKDRVHIYMKEQDEKLNNTYTRLADIESHVQEEMTHPTPGVTVINGNEFWKDNEGDVYRIHRNDVDGRGAYYKDNKWNYIYW